MLKSIVFSSMDGLTAVDHFNDHLKEYRIKKEQIVNVQYTHPERGTGTIFVIIDDNNDLSMNDGNNKFERFFSGKK